MLGAPEQWPSACCLPALPHCPFQLVSSQCAIACTLRRLLRLLCCRRSLAPCCTPGCGLCRVRLRRQATVSEDEVANHAVHHLSDGPSAAAVLAAQGAQRRRRFTRSNGPARAGLAKRAVQRSGAGAAREPRPSSPVPQAQRPGRGPAAARCGWRPARRLRCCFARAIYAAARPQFCTLGRSKRQTCTDRN